MEFVHCINMLPFTPITEELLGRDFMEQEWPVLETAFDNRDLGAFLPRCRPRHPFAAVRSGFFCQFRISFERTEGGRERDKEGRRKWGGSISVARSVFHSCFRHHREYHRHNPQAYDLRTYLDCTAIDEKAEECRL